MSLVSGLSAWWWPSCGLYQLEWSLEAITRRRVPGWCSGVWSRQQSVSLIHSHLAKFASSNNTCPAVVVGTLPVFAIFFRRRQYTRRYGSYPNGSEPRNPSRNHRSDPDRTPNSTHKIKLSAINVTRTLEVSWYLTVLAFSSHSINLTHANLFCILQVTRSSHSIDHYMDMDEDPLRNSYPR